MLHATYIGVTQDSNLFFYTQPTQQDKRESMKAARYCKHSLKKSTLGGEFCSKLVLFSTSNQLNTHFFLRTLAPPVIEISKQLIALRIFCNR